MSFQPKEVLQQLLRDFEAEGRIGGAFKVH